MEGLEQLVREGRKEMHTGSGPSGEGDRSDLELHAFLMHYWRKIHSTSYRQAGFFAICSYLLVTTVVHDFARPPAHLCRVQASPDHDQALDITRTANRVDEVLKMGINFPLSVFVHNLRTCPADWDSSKWARCRLKWTKRGRRRARSEQKLVVYKRTPC